MGGRAVEGTGLENRQARKGLVGSNPTPSAMRVDCERVGQRAPVSGVRIGLIAARLALRLTPISGLRVTLGGGANVPQYQGDDHA